MYTFAQKMKIASSPLLRIGISFVFIWFGLQQLLDAGAWTRLIPSWVIDILPLAVDNIVRLNGSFEIVFGILLLLGLFTRIVALILALHVAHITYIIGYNAIGVRDFGLTMATLSIFLSGFDSFSLDSRIKKGRSVTS